MIISSSSKDSNFHPTPHRIPPDPIPSSSPTLALELSHCTSSYSSTRPRHDTGSISFVPSISTNKLIVSSHSTRQLSVDSSSLKNSILESTVPKQSPLQRTSVHFPKNSSVISSIRTYDPSDLSSKILSDSVPLPHPSPPSRSDHLKGSAEPILGEELKGKPLERNLLRLDHAIDRHESMLGESPHSLGTVLPPVLYLDKAGHLPNDISKMFAFKIFPPRLKQPPRRIFSIDLFKSILSSFSPTPKPSPFCYCIDDPDIGYESAEKNDAVLKSFDYDLQRLIDHHPRSVISPGSEFRSPKILEPLLCAHPHWPRLLHILTKGVTFSLLAEEYEPARHRENLAALRYGNHSSGKSNPRALLKVIEKDASKGYSFPITKECALKIRRGRISPMGVAHQMGIDEDGSLVPKDRLTHDQSFSFGHCPSLNALIDPKSLIDLVLGHCLSRIIHQIVTLRRHYPNTGIFISKYDWSSAYRRVTGDGSVAARCITIDPSNAYCHVGLRLTFGGKANPAEFSVVSDMCNDLCNDIADFHDWNPSILSSPLQDGVGRPKRYPESIPFAPARELAIHLEPRPQGYHDVYLDDTIQLFLDTPEHVARAPGIVPLAVDLMSRPVSPDEPILRAPMLEEKKLIAEGSPRERQRVLGWILDTRRLLLRLPEEKYLHRLSVVTTLTRTKRTTYQDLSKIIGQLLNAVQGFPIANYWLTRLNEFKVKIERDFRAKHPVASTDKDTTPSPGPSLRPPTPKPWYRYHLPEAVVFDLHVWPSLLQRAREGISLNLLTTRKPNHLLLGDSCPSGMGGFSIRTGMAWRYQISADEFTTVNSVNPEDTTPSPPKPPKLNNLFEFIAIVITIWIDCLNDTINPDDAVLCLSDSSSAVGWLHKSSFSSAKPLHRTVAQRLTEIVLQYRFALQAEHIPGSDNNVSDLLSRRFDLSDDELTSLLRSSYPNQIPSNFVIKPLPKEVTCWLSSVAQKPPESSSENLKPATRKETEPGAVGSNSSDPQDSLTTPSSTPCQQPTTEQPLPVLSYNNSGTPTLRLDEPSRFAQALCRKPLATWFRSSGITTGQAPITDRTTLPSIPWWPASSEPGSTSTHQNNARKLSPPSISSSHGKKPTRLRPTHPLPPTPPRSKRARSNSAVAATSTPLAPVSTPPSLTAEKPNSCALETSSSPATMSVDPSSPLSTPISTPKPSSSQ